MTYLLVKAAPNTQVTISIQFYLIVNVQMVYIIQHLIVIKHYSFRIFISSFCIDSLNVCGHVSSVLCNTLVIDSLFLLF